MLDVNLMQELRLEASNPDDFTSWQYQSSAINSLELELEIHPMYTEIDNLQLY